jgi:hypothetical protein
VKICFISIGNLGILLSSPVMSKTTDNGLKRAEKARSNLLNLSDCLCLTPFSAIFQLNHGNHS